jgi:hypothetical protein
MANDSFDDVNYFLLGLQVANNSRIFNENSDEEFVTEEEAEEESNE